MAVPRDPEPLQWRSRIRLRDRLIRALTTPILVGAVLFVVAMAITVAFVFSRPEVASITAAQLGDSQSEASAPAGPSIAAEAEPSDKQESAASVFVHVVGEVHHPGVVELPAGARVDQALAAAGGATENAALAGVNLARVVVDGEQIVVPDSTLEQSEAGGVGSSPGVTGTLGDDTVNINSADATQLQTLPGIGPALAQRILEWRLANGAFAHIDQLLDIDGIGHQTLARLRDRVRV